MLSINNFIFAITIFLSAIMWHELGHVIYFRSRGIKPKTRLNKKPLYLEIGSDDDYEKLTNKEFKHLNISGILSGLIPIIFSSLIFSAWFLFLIPYIIGCKHDIKNIIQPEDFEE